MEQLNTKNNLRRYYPDFKDPSTLALIMSNLVTIVLAVVQNWNFLTVLWVYLLQSIIIGFFHYVRLLSLKNFTTEGMTMTFNGVPIKLSSDRKSKLIIANFFAFHFGFFHAIYLAFLLFFEHIAQIDQSTTGVDMKYIFTGAAIFFTNHLFSYIYNRKSLTTTNENIGTLMLFPYARVIPMQLTIVFGLPLPLFLSLKSVIDVVMHTIEQRKNTVTNVPQTSASEL